MTAKADRIKALLEDENLKEAFKIVRERYRDMIEDTPVSDDTALLDIRKMLHLLRDVEEHLHTAIEDGHLQDFRAQEHEESEKWQKKH